MVPVYGFTTISICSSSSLFGRPALRLRLGRKSPHEGYRDIYPPAHRVRLNGRIHVDIAVHRATAHFHLASARLGERFRLPILTDAQQQAAFRRTNEKIAVEHEADAAEHLDFHNRLDTR